MAKKQIRSGGGRKKGRNLKGCLTYKNRQQRERNKAIKIARHLRRHPEDTTALKAIDLLPLTFAKAAKKAYS